MKGSAHDSLHLLYHRFISELFTEYDEMWNLLVYMCYAQTIVELSRKLINTSQKTMPTSSSFLLTLLEARK